MIQGLHAMFYTTDAAKTTTTNTNTKKKRIFAWKSLLKSMFGAGLGKSLPNGQNVPCPGPQVPIAICKGAHGSPCNSPIILKRFR